MTSTMNMPVGRPSMPAFFKAKRKPLAAAIAAVLSACVAPQALADDDWSAKWIATYDDPTTRNWSTPVNNWTESGNHYNLAGRDLVIGRNGPNGGMHVPAGWLVSSRRGVIAGDGGSKGYANVGGCCYGERAATWVMSSDLTVGVYGDGQMNVYNPTGLGGAGGIIRSHGGTLAAAQGSFASVAVYGRDSTWISTNGMTVGNEGKGSLGIDNGGSVHSSGANFTVGKFGAPQKTGDYADSVKVGENGYLNIENILVVGDRDGARGQVTVVDGGLYTKGSYLGSNLGSKGQVTMSGGSWVNEGHAMLIGSGGEGGLTLLARAQMLNYSAANLGFQFGSEGVVAVHQGSNWDIELGLIVGTYGTGRLYVQSGATVNSWDSTSIGEFSNGVNQRSSGFVDVAGVGSLLNVGMNLKVGNWGYGELNVRDGGQVTVGNAARIGEQAGGVGTVTVSGKDSLLAVTGGNGLWVGNLGRGTLKIEDGGKVSVNGNVQINDHSSLQLGDGTLELLQGGQLQNNGQFIVLGSNDKSFANVISGTGSLSKLGTGALTLTGINTYTGVTNVNAGKLLLEGGGRISNTSYASIGEETGSDGWLTVSGRDSKLNVGINLKVGNYGKGSMLIENGGQVTVANAARIGDETGGEGWLTVKGKDSLLAVTGANGLWVGGLGQGTLKIEDGGKVSVKKDMRVNSQSSLALGDGTLELLDGKLKNDGKFIVSGVNNKSFASAIDGVGSLEVKGSGWFTLTGANTYSGGTTVSSGALQIGAGGTTGSISGNVLTQGGLIFNRSDAHSFAGTISGSGSLGKLGAGTLTLSGVNSYTGNTYVNSGTLAIANGGQVAGGIGFVAYEQGMQANVKVSGPNSRWVSSSYITVGEAGTGTLTIENGGVVSNTSSSLGYASTGQGTATVTGAGSRWENSSTVYVGNQGTGTLNIQNSGVVTADLLSIGAKGLVKLEGGTLSANQVNVDGGKLASTGDNSIQAKLSNKGKIESTAGTLSLAGDVSGAGSFAGKIAFKAAFNPGNSPAAVNFGGGDVSFDSASVLNIELFGSTPGTGYDQLLHINKLTFNGTLNLAFGNGFVPTAGSQLSLFDFQSFGGSFGANFDHINVSGYDKSRLDLSHLASNGTISVTAVPEPGSWALMLAGLTALVGLSRRRLTVQAPAGS